MYGQGGVDPTCQATTLPGDTALPSHANDRSLAPVACQVLQPGTTCSLSLCCGFYVGGFLLADPALPISLLQEQQENPGAGAAGILSQAGDCGCPDTLGRLDLNTGRRQLGLSSCLPALASHVPVQGCQNHICDLGSYSEFPLTRQWRC